MPSTTNNPKAICVQPTTLAGMGGLLKVYMDKGSSSANAKTPVHGGDQLYIHPDECIDCGACVPACPVSAIFPEEDMPEQWLEYIEKNRRLSAGPNLHFRES